MLDKYLDPDENPVHPLAYGKYVPATGDVFIYKNMHVDADELADTYIHEGIHDLSSYV